MTRKVYLLLVLFYAICSIQTVPLKTVKRSERISRQDSTYNKVPGGINYSRYNADTITVDPPKPEVQEASEEETEEGGSDLVIQVLTTVHQSPTSSAPSSQSPEASSSPSPSPVTTTTKATTTAAPVTTTVTPKRTTTAAAAPVVVTTEAKAPVAEAATVAKGPAVSEEAIVAATTTPVLQSESLKLQEDLKSKKLVAFIGGHQILLEHGGKPCVHVYGKNPYTGQLKLKEISVGKPNATCLIIFQSVPGFILNIDVKEILEKGDMVNVPPNMGVFQTKRKGRNFSFRKRVEVWSEIATEEDIHVYTRNPPENWVVNYNHNCGAKLTAEATSKVIYSHPGYGNTSYPFQYSCDWFIESGDSSSRVGLLFNKVDLEKCCDLLEVRDGPQLTSPLILSTKNTSLTTMQPLISSGNSVTLKFRTNEVQSLKGFEIIYYSLEND